MSDASVHMQDFRHVPVARGYLSRIRGLIGSHALFLYIPRCAAVHTCFMRSAIDLVFLDEGGVILALRHFARPWRIFVGPRGTCSVLELPPGHAATCGLGVGDRIAVNQP